MQWYMYFYIPQVFSLQKSPHFYIPLYRIRHKKGAPLTKQQKHPFITHNLFGMGLTTTATHSCFRTRACRCCWTTYALHTCFLSVTIYTPATPTISNIIKATVKFAISILLSINKQLGVCETPQHILKTLCYKARSYATNSKSAST